MKHIVYLLAVVAIASASDTTDRVKGGTNAVPGEFPYQASIWHNNRHICGGVLITTKHVVTAASCLVHILRNPQLSVGLKVLVGTIDQTTGGIVYDVSQISVYPDYQYNQQYVSYENDIGVLHLKYNVELSPFVKPIDLPAYTELAPNTELTFSGWGSTTSNGPSVQFLQKAKLRFIDRAECQRLYPNKNVKMYLLCTAPNYYVGTCTTDSGGPLVYQNTLVGISSGQHGCGNGLPDIFTKVSYYLKFLIDEINRPR